MSAAHDLSTIPDAVLKPGSRRQFERLVDYLLEHFGEHIRERGDSPNVGIHIQEIYDERKRRGMTA